jgi:flagellar biosynthesis chaperone FliJ
LNEALEISNEDLFQISKYISTNSYNSQKITYKNIMDDMNSKIDHKLNVEYNFYNDTIDNHKKEIKDNKNNIETLDTEVNKIN